MGDVHHCSRAPVSEMTYTVSSGTLNSTIPYNTPLETRTLLKLFNFFTLSSTIIEVGNWVDFNLCGARLTLRLFADKTK